MLDGGPGYEPMKRYLYKWPSGAAEASEYLIPEILLQGRVLVREIETETVTADHVVTKDGDVVQKERDYASRRRSEYPEVADQLDALWHAMDSGQIPMVPEFYEPIREVKARHPKGSN